MPVNRHFHRKRSRRINNHQFIPHDQFTSFLKIDQPYFTADWSIGEFELFIIFNTDKSIFKLHIDGQWQRFTELVVFYRVLY